uniref:Venom protease n=2 Tax=Lygus hesperus TaxID=30085 RepID=A0A0A9YLH9_LYGHE
MKRNAAVIYVVLLMTSYCCHCDVDSNSDESNSEEYYDAKGCSQKECGQAAVSEPKPQSERYQTETVRESINAHGSSQDTLTYPYKGSNWTETNSQTQERISWSFHFGLGIHKESKTQSSNQPTEEVTGNWKPQTVETTRRTTTLPPRHKATVNANAVKTRCGGSNDGDNLMVSQDDDQETLQFLPSPPDCGISLNNRVVGGTQSTVGKWPWMVTYGFRDKQTRKEFVWMCGGSLVTQKHTITVAHCLLTPTHYIDVARIGAIFLNSTLDETNEQRKVNKTFVIHSEYLRNPRRRKHDIAIVTLMEPFSKQFKPICLPFQRDMKNNQFIRENAIVAGWGATSYDGFISEVLLDVKLPIVDNEKCRKFYASKRVDIDSNHICAGGEAGKDSCRGDSGGPLMFKNDTTYFLIGVVAFGSACGIEGSPGVYTRITSHLDWLIENLKDK